MEDQKTPKAEETNPTVAVEQTTTAGSSSTTAQTQTVVSQTKTTTIEGSEIAKSIEHAADNGGTNEEKPKSFLTKKRIIIGIIFFVVSLLLIFLTIRYVLKINWFEFFRAVHSGFEHKIGILWFFMLLLYAFVNILRTFITLMPRIKSLNCKIPFWDYLLFGITICFLGQVTPSSLIVDPYTVFWMKTHGISTSKCASILFSNTLFWQICEIITTLPPLIICIVHRHSMFNYFEGGVASGKIIYSLIIIGCIIDYIGLIFVTFMCMSKSFHYRLSCIFNWFKKKFHMKYHTKPEIVEKYKVNAVIKTDFIQYLKDWKTSLVIFLLFAAGSIFCTFALCFCISFVQFESVLFDSTGQMETIAVPFNWGWMFVCAKLSTPANRLNLLPGAAVLLEKSLTILMNSLGGWSTVAGANLDSLKQAQSTIADNSAFIGRIYGGYIPAIIGIGGFITLTIQQIRLSTKGKLTKSIY